MHYFLINFTKKILNTSSPNHYKMEITFTVPSDHTEKVILCIFIQKNLNHGTLEK